MVDALLWTIKGSCLIIDVDRITLTRIKQDSFSMNFYPAIFGFQDFTDKNPEPLFFKESFETDFYDHTFFHIEDSLPVQMLSNTKKI